MVRKTLIALIASVGVCAGSGVLSSADARVFVSIGIGHPFMGHHCGWRNVYVKVWSPSKHRYVRRWVTRRVCW